ncbi:type VII secretion protein EccB [Actinophytocola gossypii]|uniref:Type VII secretion protein EccB n=1 Tax=Actinophytocola gossypii TaxID=2812003 RepID=A0ABT2JHE1_9PSEU|nr:type VII secretion protein EccB [Actinophytocola gossypii]MCT2587303.1 type VII secretion protein EccB [Actinophytocola gossypii]
MPSTPTTKSQVQAYRFVLRRMQSALVRKDAVMLHDPMRTHSRATIVGVCLAALGMLGFLIWGILSPKPTAPNSDGIVIGKPSGQVYVMIAQPEKQLIPVFDLASARLLLHARKQDDSQGPSGSDGPGTAAATNVQVVAPEVIDDNELRNIPRGRLSGIPGGPGLLPSKDQRVGPPWTVCDETQLNREGSDENVDENDPTAKNSETTVMAGVDQLGEQLAQGESLLVRLDAESAEQDPAEQPAYLVYRTPGSANLPNTSAVRAEVDLSDSAVRNALDLSGLEPREISVGLLNAIPEKAELTAPGVTGTVGEQADVDLGDSDLEKVGSVFQVQRAASEPQFYVVHRDGVEQIKETTADLLRFTNSEGAEIVAVSPEVISAAEKQDRIDDSTFPESRTEVLEARNFPVACLSWKTVGEGVNREARTAVYIGKVIPGDPKPVRISSPSADGVRIDWFYMPPGHGAVVRQATSSADFDKGQITLVSDRGVKYGIPDSTTAAVLGLSDQLPAPRSIIGLLPDGASLSADDAQQSFDSVDVEQGVYPTEDGQEQPSGGGAGQSGGG